MRTGLIAAGLGVLLATAGCSGSDERQWMKVNERYTTEEFRRDFAECSKSGKLDDTCMRARGWVAVNPSKGDRATPDPRANRGPRY
jgi:hypothetical protein